MSPEHTTRRPSPGSAKRGDRQRAKASRPRLRVLGLLVLLVAAGVPLASAHAGGSAKDNQAPRPWSPPPTAPAATRCKFCRVFMPPWKKRGAGNTSHDKVSGVGNMLCVLVGDAESYSNAAVLASEIWAYTWSHDGNQCHFDEAATVNSEGIGTEVVRYMASPHKDCHASITATVMSQFSWRIEGKGNVEVEVAGLMHCNGSDLTFPQPTISGGKAAFVGTRSGNAPRPPQVTIQLGSPPFLITIPFGVGGAPFLAPDEGMVGRAQPNVAPPVPLTHVGEALTLRGYAKALSYADEAGVLSGAADVQGFIFKSDPGLTVKLMCGGKPTCNAIATSTYKK